MRGAPRPQKEKAFSGLPVGRKRKFSVLPVGVLGRRFLPFPTAPEEVRLHEIGGGQQQRKYEQDGGNGIPDGDLCKNARIRQQSRRNNGKHEQSGGACRKGRAFSFSACFSAAAVLSFSARAAGEPSEV